MTHMKTNKFRLLRKNRGFAILFSLGLLSVILVIVMLFASRAKVASNISSIHLENQAARTLAKSLIPRIMLTINESQGVQDQILFSSIHDENNDALCKEYRNKGLYSYDWLWKLEHPAHIKFTPTVVKGKNVVSGTFRFYATQNEKKAPEFDDKNPYVPTWQYILDIPRPDDENMVDGELPKTRRGVIARFAFVIIPKIAHLNPNAIADHTHCTMLSGISLNHISDHGSCNKCARKLGNSAAELMFGPPDGVVNTTKTLKNTGDGYVSNNVITDEAFAGKNNKWATIEDFCYSFGINPPAYNASDKEITDYLSSKDTVTRFMEIDNTGDREAFWSDDGDPTDNDKGKNDGVRDDIEFYHRFNMRRTDWQTLTIDDIKAETKKWSKLAEQEPKIDGSNNHNTGGIPWLANWKDKGDWKNEKDTQNQVIANLLNYCSDATRPVVTGDSSGNELKPHNWKTTDPAYTGLKRTLYINEVFYNIKLQSEADVDYDGENTVIDAYYNLNSEFMVELVDMYLNTLGDKENNPIKFKSSMKEADFSLYKPEIYGTLSFQVKNLKTGAWEQKSYDLAGKCDDFKRLEDDTESSYLPITGKRKMYGYYGYRASFDDKIEYDSYEESGDVSVEAVLAKMEVRNVRLEIKKILLYRTPTDDEKKFLEGNDSPEYKSFPEGLTEKDSAGNPKEYVDCALVSLSHRTVPITKAYKTGADDGKTLFALCGDREAIDPRQNLRADDWATTKTKIYSDTTNHNECIRELSTLPIQTYEVSGGQTIPHNVIPTNKAVVANPPKLAKSGAKNTRDYEETEDPSWKLENGVKVAPTKNSHISTAFIRHAVLRRPSNNPNGIVEYPMESLWELGAIHRGSRWQTLNLSYSKTYTSAEGFVNEGADAYEDGDGPILDQVKMTNDSSSFGKINLIRHVDQEVRNTVVGSLFMDMPVHRYGFYISQAFDDAGKEDQNLFPNKPADQVRIHDEEDPNHGNQDGDIATDNDRQWYHTSYVAALYDTIFGDYGNEEFLSRSLDDPDHKNKFWRRTDFLAMPKKVGSHINSSNLDFDDILFPIRQDYGSTTDAMEEQIIGRTINLMKIDSTVKGATAILIVQILKDAARVVDKGGAPSTVFKDWDGDGIINTKNYTDKEKEGMLMQLQSGYRRFTDMDDDDPGFYLPPITHKEKIKSELGTYENGADAITGETKVAITLDFDTATQKWILVKYEYAD